MFDKIKVENPAKLLIRPREGEQTLEQAKWREKQAAKRLGFDIGTLFPLWYAMNHRCYSENNDSYANYGGRGIRVSTRWRRSFVQFCLDMGDRPEGRYSLDRIDNDGNYCHSNCRWVTRKVQFHNTRRRIKLTVPLILSKLWEV